MTKLPGYDQLKRAGIASWSVLGAMLLLAALIWVIEAVSVVWPPLVLAVAVIYLLAPLVDLLQKYKVPRIIGSCLSYLLFAGLLVALGFVVIPVIQDQFAEFGTRFPQIVDDVEKFITDLGTRLGFTVGTFDFQSILNWSSTFFSPDRIQSLLNQVGTFAKTGMQVLAVFVLGPVLAFYILMDLPSIRRRTRNLIPERLRSELVHVANQVGRVVSGFVRGQLLVALIVGLLSSLGLWLLGVPFWLVIGMTAGLLNIIPFVGPFVGGALAGIVSLLFNDVATAIWAVLMFVAVQQFDNHVISPNILRRRVQLHPVFILLALLLGASLGGFFGILIAVPVAAVIKVVAGHFWRTRVLGESWEEAAEAVAPEYVPPSRETIVGRLRRVGPPEAHEVNQDEAETTSD
jgi:predicted PurR-regulated permease PerM